MFKADKLSNIPLAVLLLTAALRSAAAPDPEQGEDSSTFPQITFGAPGGDQMGAEVFGSVCAACHGNNVAIRAPGFISLTGMSPRAIVSALETGRMRAHGEALTPAQRRSVAEWLTGRELTESALPASAYCRDIALSIPADGQPAWSGWGGNPEATGFRDSERAGLTWEDIPGLELKWAFAFPDAVQQRSKPALIGNLLIVGSQFGEVYGLDAATGCVQWLFTANAGIRGAISIGAGPGGEPLAFFVDFRTDVYALRVADGKKVWSARAGNHPEHSNTGSLAYHAGRLYIPLSTMEGGRAQDPSFECCKTSGQVVAMDAGSGEILWRHRVIGEEAREVGVTQRGTKVFAPSGAPVWSSPTIDARRGLVYVGTGENFTRPATDSSDAIVALRLHDGSVAWRFQGTRGDSWNLACMSATDTENCPEPAGPDLDFGIAPVLATMPDGRQVLVTGQKSGVVWALDPDQDGKVLWQVKIGKGGTLGGVHWGIATDGRYAYVPNSDTPAGFMGIEPDFPVSPGVFALDLANGKLAWRNRPDDHTCGPRPGCINANSAAPTAIPGVLFAGSLDGHLRAYSTVDGSVLWDFDTTTVDSVVNGIEPLGGAIDGPGPVVAGGMVFSQSGYNLFGQMPGNLLLAFGVAKTGSGP